MGRKQDGIWAAGFIDGEAAVRIRRVHDKRRNITSYTVAVNVCQVDRTPLEKLQRLYGGAINPKVPTARKRVWAPNSAPYYSWMITGLRAAKALQEMLPHLTTKRERAELACEFQKLIRRKCEGHGPRVTAAMQATRVAYFARMRYLNLPLMKRLAAAETKSQYPFGGSDSPNLQDGKLQDHSGNVCALA